MSGERAERRLAAILAADIAGYSRLMGADEEGTLTRLKAHRRELIDPKIAAHRGRLVKTTGDGLLVEFASVVDALRCAAELQQAMAGRNAGIPRPERIEFRIGVHQGDIIVEAGDILGDGVNVAARLEALAEPGGICVSAESGGLSRQARLSLRGHRRAQPEKYRPSDPGLPSGGAKLLRPRRSAPACHCRTSRRSRCCRSRT